MPMNSVAVTATELKITRDGGPGAKAALTQLEDLALIRRKGRATLGGSIFLKLPFPSDLEEGSDCEW